MRAPWRESLRFLLLLALLLLLQRSGSVAAEKRDSPYSPHPAAYAVPTVLIGSGITLIREWGGITLNEHTRNLLKGPRGSLSYVDDVSQYVPTATVCSMHLFRVPSRSSHCVFWEAGFTSFAAMALVINTVKFCRISLRPDYSSWNSFPSGHTATAFVGAELLRVEYGQSYPWVAVGGYVVAAGTALLRIHHDRHWLGDVLAGAGVGISSVWLAYFLQPYVDKALCWMIPPLRSKTTSLSIFPTSGLGVGIRYQF